MKVTAGPLGFFAVFFKRENSEVTKRNKADLSYICYSLLARNALIIWTRLLLVYLSVCFPKLQNFLLFI
jgi:hypothetical protein